tara:strand:+ start:6501 stop:6848 length:348 start_codon:yes stop_codon:yes gene_type:complete
MPHGENQSTNTSNSILRFYKIDGDVPQQIDLFNNLPGRQLRGYYIAQKISYDIYPTWNENSNVGEYNGVLIDPNYWYNGAQVEFFKENLSQQFRSYYIAHDYNANYYENISENSS